MFDILEPLQEADETMSLLTEMPELIKATDFSLMDRETNKQLAARLLASPHKVLEENPDTILLQTGQNGGQIALYAKGNEEIDYWVQYRRLDKKLSGTTVTQVGVWRNILSPFSKGMAEKVFFEYLLEEFPAIMSDGRHPDKGQEFWLRQLTLAVARGLEVGLVNFQRREIDWYDSDQRYADWVLGKMNAWERGQAFQGLRFIIRK